MNMLLVVIWLLAASWTMFYTHSTYTLYCTKPSVSKYERYFVPPDPNRLQSIKFPTISICSHNKVKRSFLEHSGNARLKQVWRAINPYEQRDKGLNFHHKRHSNDELQNMTFEDVIASGGPVDTHLLSCTQRNKNCNDILGSDWMLMENTVRGRCWRVNPQGTLYGKGGDWGKLQLMFWADVKDYPVTDTHPEYGFTVALHDNETYGSTISEGYYMSPGDIYKVDTTLQRETRDPPPGGHCDITKSNTSYGAYNEGACVAECRDRYLLTQCGCVSVRPPLQHHYPSCTLKQWAECGLREYNKWRLHYMDPHHQSINHDVHCYCPLACSETRYSSSLSSSAISPSYAIRLLQAYPNLLDTVSNPSANITYSTPQDLLDNLMVIELSFISMSILELRQVGTFSFYNMLGNIGGVLGLFLGASLFTMCDVLQCVCRTFQKYRLEAEGRGKDTVISRGGTAAEPRLTRFQRLSLSVSRLVLRSEKETVPTEEQRIKEDKEEDIKRETFYSVEGFPPEHVEENNNSTRSDERDTYYTADGGDLEDEITELYY